MPLPLQILLIENPADGARISQALARAGLTAQTHQVERLTTLKQALAKHPWDLVLANHQLAECPLEEGLKLFQAAGIDIPFILVSQPISKDRLALLFRAGVHGYIGIGNLYLLPPIIQHELVKAAMRRQLLIDNRALGKSETHYRTLTDNAPVSILVRCNGRIVYLNKSARKLLGFDDGEPLVDISAETIIIEAPDEITSSQPNSTQTLSGQPVQATLRHANGSQLKVEVLSSQVEHHDNPATQMVFSDITGRISLDNKLQQAAQVFENTTEGVIVTDRKANITAVNPAFTQITGYPEEAVIGRNPKFLQSGKHDKAFFKGLWGKLKQEKSWRGEIWNRRKNGEIYPAWLNITSIQDDKGEISQYVALFSDITSIKQSQSQLEHLAHHDSLTDLPNRLLFEDRLEHAITQAKRQKRHLAVLFLDLDRFKNINDSLGHSVGDALLVQVATRLRNLLRENDTAARLGGDEFTILLENLEDPNYTAVVANKILNHLKQPFEIFGRKLHITASIGLSLYPEDGTDVGNLTKNADAAMYQAKESGRNNYRFYTAELTQSAFERLLLESELRSAIKDQQLLLYYQPQFSVNSSKISGAEALLRWRHPRMGILPPARFIPLAEETGLIHEIGHWTLEHACKQTREWSQKGLFTGRMAVNLSVRQIMHTDLILRFEEIIAKTRCPPTQLQFEVTEGVFMGQKELSIPVLDVFKQLGVTIAIDDFGTGYSSLSYLKQLPIDKLKIDKSFVQEMPDDADGAAIAQAIISLGQTLGLEIIAEGVETEAQQNLLQLMGCQEMQGYLYGAPMPARSLEEKLAEETGQIDKKYPFFSA